MDNASVLAALRTHALLQAPLTALVAQRVFISRSDVAGVVPAVVLRFNGGAGKVNHAFHEVDVAVDFYSSTSWAECLQIQAAFEAAFDWKTHVNGLPAPLSSVKAKAPQQMPQGDYFHLVQPLHCIVKEA